MYAETATLATIGLGYGGKIAADMAESAVERGAGNQLLFDLKWGRYSDDDADGRWLVAYVEDRQSNGLDSWDDGLDRMVEEAW
ncbi:MAG: hypothetical protein ABS79_00490 [Planctomycetes bacterium SCN 63-9]|nr:MAG: hypothetical protein ABS79_00490 [Planctomycetes bacterium SCN 63-9]